MFLISGDGEASGIILRRSDGQSLSNEVVEVSVDSYRITGLAFTLLCYLG